MTHKPGWEKDRAHWQARYDLSRKHPELYPEELDAIMADWEPDEPPKQWADGEKAERPQQPPVTDDPDCPF
jgi:hypothetical protein